MTNRLSLSLPGLVAVLFLLPVDFACQGVEERPTPTLAVLNARVWTGDPASPWAEAFLVGGDRLLAVGSSMDIRPQIGDARVLDLTGRFVVPGFIDAHVHFLDGGRRLASVQLRDASTPEEFTRRIAEFAENVPGGTWVTGGDWDHQLWGGELPRREWIDALTPEHPVWVNRLDDHMALANSRALEAAGITEDTKDIPGGTIERDPDGTPTGILKDNAMDLVDAAMPVPTDEENDRALRAAMEHVFRQGVTSVHHMGGWDELDVFRRARAGNALTTRIYAAVPLQSWERLRDFVETEGRGDAWLRYGIVKGFVDGSLGSHTAAFHAPYDDGPAGRGFFVHEEEQLETWIRGADDAGLQVAVHAIGDRANETLLNIFERVRAEHGRRDRRFRVEHAQHLRPEAFERFSALEVIPSMQPYHAIDDGRWAERYIGPVRARTTYAFRSLLDAGARLAFGSDWTVAPASPIQGIHAAVTRRTLDGAHPDGWIPEEKISVDEALAAYTRSAAYAAFEEEEKGILRPGHLADFTVIDRDLTSVPHEQIREATILMTAVGGEIVYQKSNDPRANQK